MLNHKHALMAYSILLLRISVTQIKIYALYIDKIRVLL